jgi:hypothetical protein
MVKWRVQRVASEPSQAPGYYTPLYHCLAGYLALGTSPSAKTDALVSLVNIRKNNGLVPENNHALVFGLSYFYLP